MKTYITFLKVISIVLVLFIIGCVKDSQIGKSNNQTEINPENLIIDFANRLDSYKISPNLKSDEKMQVDSAIWYIDATLNYLYTNGNYPFARLHRDTLYTNLNMINGTEAAVNEVFNTYDDFLTGISYKYYSIEGDNKQFIMATVTDMGNISELKRKLRIVTLTGTGTLQTTGDFGESEVYNYDKYTYFDCNGNDVGTNAPQVFEAKLQAHYNSASAGTGCRWFFYGTTLQLDLNYWEHRMTNDQFDNLFDYKIFAASEAVAPFIVDTECLEFHQEVGPNGTHEMQFYYDYLKVFADEWLASEQNPGNFRFAEVNVVSTSVVHNENIYIYHAPKISFRKRGKMCFANHELPYDEQ